MHAIQPTIFSNTIPFSKSEENLLPSNEFLNLLNQGDSNRVIKIIENIEKEVQLNPTENKEMIMTLINIAEISHHTPNVIDRIVKSLHALILYMDEEQLQRTFLCVIQTLGNQQIDIKNIQEILIYLIERDVKMDVNKLLLILLDHFPNNNMILSRDKLTIDRSESLWKLIYVLIEKYPRKIEIQILSTISEQLQITWSNEAYQRLYEANQPYISLDVLDNTLLALARCFPNNQLRDFLIDRILEIDVSRSVLSSKVYTISEAALEALLNKPSETIIHRLINRLCEGQIKKDIIWILGEMACRSQPDSIPQNAIIQLMNTLQLIFSHVHHLNWQVGVHVAQALGKIGRILNLQQKKGAINSLTKALFIKSSIQNIDAVQNTAAWALGEIAVAWALEKKPVESSPEFTDLILATLIKSGQEEVNCNVRYAVIQVLNRLSQNIIDPAKHPSNFKSFLIFLKDSDVRIRKVAAEALKNLPQKNLFYTASQATAFIQAATEALKIIPNIDIIEQSETRVAVIHAIYQFAVNTSVHYRSSYIDLLNPYKSDPSPIVRYAVLNTLQNIHALKDPIS